MTLRARNPPILKGAANRAAAIIANHVGRLGTVVVPEPLFRLVVESAPAHTSSGLQPAETAARFAATSLLVSMPTDNWQLRHASVTLALRPSFLSSCNCLIAAMHTYPGMQNGKLELNAIQIYIYI